MDVSARVLRTIATRPAPAGLDLMPIAFAGGAVVVAALVFFACLPSWQIMLDPWAGYFPN